ncbi:sirohydrochlorin cobaltochelatase [Pseudovibrio ascidiaceicola]|uniref:Sirohydrochlorin cobaltochelatase n=1 Tax=Pseudovibrio ascidiaceicola TaxID=285279 RepID=A0A1I4ELP1_9HYPH|nr:CbiX/SirB N-terminal domain-containing protein [Pseudovibrio ascidiaceicola]SFL05376.1 sirohydrochlorin cobaltochelatase [Pseudovibrio ascidiaceicola]
MSGTRSPSPLVRATSDLALVLAAHGDLGGKGADNTPGHVRLKNALALLLPELDVVSGVMKGTPPLQEVVEGLPHEHVLVLPLLLSNGYFCNTVLPRRLGLDPNLQQQKEGAWQNLNRDGQYIKLLPPLGVLPFLPDLVSQSIQSTLAPNSKSTLLKPELDREVLIVAHGSTVGPESRLCALQLKDHLENRYGYKQLRVAFLSEEPFVEKAVLTLSDDAIVVPLFASGGLHGHEDISKIMESAPTGCKLAPVIGCEHALAQHLVSYLQENGLTRGAANQRVAILRDSAAQPTRAALR